MIKNTHVLIGFLLILLIYLISQTTTPQDISRSIQNASLSDLGPAPELTNDIWLNVDSALRLADLRGKVVAIDMWTFS